MSSHTTCTEPEWDPALCIWPFGKWHRGTSGGVCDIIASNGKCVGLGFIKKASLVLAFNESIVFSYKFNSPIDFNCIYHFILAANPFGFASDEAAVRKSGCRLNLTYCSPCFHVNTNLCR